jgi:hypothetical protein
MSSGVDPLHTNALCASSQSRCRSVSCASQRASSASDPPRASTRRRRAVSSGASVTGAGAYSSRRASSTSGCRNPVPHDRPRPPERRPPHRVLARRRATLRVRPAAFGLAPAARRESPRTRGARPQLARGLRTRRRPRRCKDLVAYVCPNLYLFSLRVSDGIGRHVSIAVFPSSGPPNTIASHGKLSAHLSPDDWRIATSRRQSEVV